MHLLAQSSETGKMPPSMPSNTSTMKTDMEHWFGFSFCKTIATNSHLVLHNGNPSCFQQGVYDLHTRYSGYVNLQIALFRRVGTYSIVCAFNEWGVEALPNSSRIADLIPFTSTESDVDHWLNGC